MKRQSQFYLGWYAIFIVIFGVLFPMSIVYAIDPLQFFRRAAYAPVFSTNERYQIPGLARNYSYDTVIVGSSMAQNFYPSYADKVLGARTLKIAISGSSAREQFLVLSVAIRTGKVKRVIWGLDRWVFRGAPERVRNDLAPFPYYLYDNNPLERFWYLFNGSYFWESIQIVAGGKWLYRNSAERVPDDWDTVDKFYHYNHAAAIKDYFNPANRIDLNDSNVLKAIELPAMKKSFDANVLALIRDNPEIEFILYFPPYSILHAKLYQANSAVTFERLVAFQALMIEQLVEFRNVSVFDFSDASAITQNLDLYMDLGHFNASVNEYIIGAIASGEHRVDLADPLASIRRFRAQVEAYKEPEMLGSTLSGAGTK